MYAERYRFSFASDAGKGLSIRLYEDGYTGSVQHRSLGSSPSLRYERNENVMGSSLTFEAECAIDNEFADLYTSDPLKYRVDVYNGSSLVWQGFITPELYAAPWIDPPYNVQLTATDGLGELKRYDYTSSGRETLGSILGGLLARTGLSYGLTMISSMQAYGGAPASFLTDVQANLASYNGKTCYDVLQGILASLHAVIMVKGQKFVLLRESDLEGAISGTTVTSVDGDIYPLEFFGSMDSYSVWPVGQMKMEIQPARRGLKVSCPNDYAKGLLPDIQSFGVSGGATKLTDCIEIPANGVISAGAILPATDSKPADLQLAIKVRNSATDEKNMLVMVQAIGKTGTSSTAPNVNRWLVRGTRRQEGDYATSWVTTSQWMNIPVQAYSDGTERDATEQTLVLPFQFLGGRCSGFQKVSSITVSIKAEDSTLYVYSATLEAFGSVKGIDSVVTISNGARGDAEAVETALADTVSANKGIDYIVNAPYKVAEFRSGTIAYCPLGEFLAKDYARSCALPRLRLTGTLNVDVFLLSMFYVNAGLKFLAESLCWDMAHDELEVSLLSLPAAEVDIASVTITDSEGNILQSSGVFPSIFSLPAAGQTGLTLEIRVSASQAWTITGAPNWTVFSRTSGTGPATVTFSTTGNTSSRSRTASVSVAGQSVKITQAAATQTLNVSPSTLSFANTSGSSRTVTVSASNEWRLREHPAWLTITPTAGNGGDTTVTIVTNESNATLSERSAVINFETTVGSVAKSVTATQAAGEQATGEARFASESVEVGRLANSWVMVGVIEKQIATRAFTYDASWLAVSFSSGLLTIYATQANTGTTSRSATVTGTWTDTNGFTITDTLTVVQVAAETISLSSSTASLANTAGSSTTIVVNASASWAVGELPSWLSVTPGTGEAGQTSVVIATTDSNSMSTSRSRTLTFTTGDGAQASIEVTQAAGVQPVGSASFNASTVGLDRLGKAQSVGVTETLIASRSFSSSESWLTVGYANGAITLSASENTTTTSRSATVTGTWVDTNGFTITKTLPVTQQGRVQGRVYMTFDVTPAEAVLQIYTSNRWMTLSHDAIVDVGIGSTTTLRATCPGYQTWQENVTISEDTTVTIALEPVVPTFRVTGYSGAYDLAYDDECDQLIAELDEVVMDVTGADIYTLGEFLGVSTQAEIRAWLRKETSAELSPLALDYIDGVIEAFASHGLTTEYN